MMNKQFQNIQAKIKKKVIIQSRIIIFSPNGTSQ